VGGLICTSADTMRCPGWLGRSVSLIVAVSCVGTWMCNPLATVPPITSTVSATAVMPMALPGSFWPVKTMPNSAAHTPARIATGTAVGSASRQSGSGHG
jgi:hypothetical protein